ncbi:MAG TPA: membrane protein insertion efficiency factor YidD [Parachlamydiales bacterium]|nr:membrane protein insertion efficiency factor YidD [Parachlamydiales bacterium]
MIKWTLLKLIRFYQLAISPFLGSCCRFAPTCSQYAAECIQKHGALKGGWLTLKRLAKCHPFHSGGFDPAP